MPANMTDQQAALTTVVVVAARSSAQELLADFYQAWQHESLVVNQWFQVQAYARSRATWNGCAR